MARALTWPEAPSSGTTEGSTTQRRHHEPLPLTLLAVSLPVWATQADLLAIKQISLELVLACAAAAQKKLEERLEFAQ